MRKGLEVPGEEVCNLTVIKEKSIFQDEGPSGSGPGACRREL